MRSPDQGPETGAQVLSTAVILLNYRRPYNIGRIASVVASALPDAGIFILDQSGSSQLQGRNDVPWSRVWFRRAFDNTGAGARIQLAANLPFARFLAIDDDVFLDPEQITRLEAALVRDPGRVHGTIGQSVYIEDGEYRVIRGVRSGPVSFVNMVYGFSRLHAKATIALSKELGFPTWSQVRYGDDILLSSASALAPMCHDLGPIRICSSSETPGIAIMQADGFVAARRAILRRLLDLNRLHLCPP